MGMKPLSPSRDIPRRTFLEPLGMQASSHQLVYGALMESQVMTIVFLWTGANGRGEDRCWRIKITLSNLPRANQLLAPSFRHGPCSFPCHSMSWNISYHHFVPTALRDALVALFPCVPSKQALAPKPRPFSSAQNLACTTRHEHTECATSSLLDLLAHAQRPTLSCVTCTAAQFSAPMRPG
jgi:hypothetical protein